jgi:hypothetical protein
MVIDEEHHSPKYCERKLFALYGLPKVVVSDNGPQLTSAEMERFLRQNGVKHSFSPPYHPATNGAAERCVQTVKNVLKKYLLESVGGDQALQNFLLSYRVTPHGTTNRSPAEMFLRRSPRTRFSMLKPDVTDIVREKQTAQKQQHDANACAEPPSFVVGEIVRVKNVYDGIERFVKGAIAKVVGPYRYLVRIGNRCRFVHSEHLRKTGELSNGSNVSLTELETGSNVSLTEPVLPPVPPNYPVANPVQPPFVPVVPRSPVRVFEPEQSPSRASVQSTSHRQMPSLQNVPMQRQETLPSTPRRSTRERKAPQRLIETI